MIARYNGQNLHGGGRSYFGDAIYRDISIDTDVTMFSMIVEGANVAATTTALDELLRICSVSDGKAEVTGGTGSTAGDITYEIGGKGLYHGVRADVSVIRDQATVKIVNVAFIASKTNETSYDTGAGPVGVGRGIDSSMASIRGLADTIYLEVALDRSGQEERTVRGVFKTTAIGSGGTNIQTGRQLYDTHRDKILQSILLTGPDGNRNPENGMILTGETFDSPDSGPDMITFMLTAAFQPYENPLTFIKNFNVHVQANPAPLWHPNAGPRPLQIQANVSIVKENRTTVISLASIEEAIRSAVQDQIDISDLVRVSQQTSTAREGEQVNITIIYHGNNSDIFEYAEMHEFDEVHRGNDVVIANGRELNFESAAGDERIEVIGISIKSRRNQPPAEPRAFFTTEMTRGGSTIVRKSKKTTREQTLLDDGTLVFEYNVTAAYKVYSVTPPRRRPGGGSVVPITGGR